MATAIDITALQRIEDPFTGLPFARRITQGSASQSLNLDTPYLAHPQYGSFYTALRQIINQAAQRKVDLTTHYQPPQLAHTNDSKEPKLSQIKNIIAVGSGKGGVGKSTVTTLIALSLRLLGAKVGILDADIYGPNQMRLLGIESTAKLKVSEDNRFTPLYYKDIPVVSFGGINTGDTPVVWRGPMISSAVQQLLLHTHWPELDLLVIDLPPGTGDIQLTLASAVSIGAFTLVTTPQALALSEAKKTLSMAHKLHMPIAGVVENMGRFICPDCQSEHTIFGDATARTLPANLHRLGSLPIDPDIQNAEGMIQFDPNNQSCLEAIQIAESLSLILARLAPSAEPTPMPPHIIARQKG